MNSFGLINNVYKAYFNISYYAIDWFTLIQIPGVVAATIIFAYFNNKSLMGFRNLFIIMESCAIIASTSLIVSFAYPYLYWFIYLGQFTVGFSFQAVGAIITTFATNWFPENQIGLAMSSRTTGMSLGCLLAFLVPSQIIPSPPTSHDSENVTEVVKINETMTEVLKINETIKWQKEVHSKATLFYGSLLALSILVLILSVLFVAEYPPKPPTVAQALLRTQLEEKSEKQENFFNSCKSILFNKVIFHGAFVCGFTYTSNFFQKLFSGQIIRHVLEIENYVSHVNAMSGYMLVLYEIGCFIGGILGARLIDNFKKHKLTLCLALSSGIVAIFGLTLGNYFHKIEVIFVFNTLLGISISSCDVPLFDMMIQHTYPTSPIFVMLLFFGECRLILVVIAQIGRVFLDYVNGTAVLLLMGCTLILSLILSILLKPDFKRQEATFAEINANETNPLLKNDK